MFVTEYFKKAEDPLSKLRRSYYIIWLPPMRNCRLSSLCAASSLSDSCLLNPDAVGGRTLISLVPTFTVSQNSEGTETVAIFFQLIVFPHPIGDEEFVTPFTVLSPLLVITRLPSPSHLNVKVPRTAYAESLKSLTVDGRLPQVVSPSHPSTLVQIVPQYGHFRNSDTPCSLWYARHSVLTSYSTTRSWLTMLATCPASLAAPSP